MSTLIVEVPINQQQPAPLSRQVQNLSGDGSVVRLTVERDNGQGGWDTEAAVVGNGSLCTLLTPVQPRSYRWTAQCDGPAQLQMQTYVAPPPGTIGAQVGGGV